MKDLTKLIFGIIATIILGLTGVVYHSLAGGIEKNEQRCNTNRKNVQTFSVNQAVIADRVKKTGKDIEQMEKDRKDDVVIIHRRITSTQEKIQASEDRILKAISEIKK